MGKKQHSKDRLFLTATEWKTLYGGKKANNKKSGSGFKRLPFYCCSLSQQPFVHPYCTKEGVIFDIMNVVPFIKKHGISPVDGKKMTPKDLIKLNFHKNAEGRYHCPVTFKPFNDNTFIVAIRTTGNVFAKDAVDEMNIKAKYMKDLISDEPFKREDIIVLQDPSDLNKFDVATFYYVLKNIKAKELGDGGTVRAMTLEGKEAMKELKSYKPEDVGITIKKPEPVADVDPESFNAAHYSTGSVAASFTSTATAPETKQRLETIGDEELRYDRVKKKGYIQLITNFGNINLELEAILTPKTCENFILLCEAGYYNSTKFHRLIKHFMIQGGDPTGTGKGGESAWGGKFKDEIAGAPGHKLHHAGRGVLSMANTGPDTNGSQFFITFRTAKHLDRKHTIFGKVVGGFETLTAMEAVETDKATDKPLKEIEIIATKVFVNPFTEVDELMKAEREKNIKTRNTVEDKKVERPKLVAKGSGVGKYLVSAKKAYGNNGDVDEDVPVMKKQKVARSDLKDFSGW